MKELLLLAAAIGLSLAVVVTTVVAGHDTRLFVPPPESVSEQFVRKVVAGRYELAMDHVAAAADLSPAIVRAKGEDLRRRSGKVNNVEGEPGVAGGKTATAAVVVKTERAGEVRLTFSLVRRLGEWRVADWRE